MRRLEVDCNFNYLGPAFPALSQDEVVGFFLTPHEIVVAFQDEDEWEGEVLFDPSLPELYRWYVKIDIKRKAVSSGETPR